MVARIRFHLDEHIGHAVARGLRQRGINVTTTIEAGLRTQTDEAQLAYVLQEQRVLVTNDAVLLVGAMWANIILGLFIMRRILIRLVM